MAGEKILIIDDDVDVLKITSKYLTANGFEVKFINNPKKGISLAKEYHPDCILLDIMMPDMNGIQVCKIMRSFSNSPIIFLTGKAEEADKIIAFSSGADDYIIKPFSLGELNARINAILRRTGYINKSTSIKNNSAINYGDLKIDLLTHKVTYKTEELLLTKREYEIFLFLARNPYAEITFEELGSDLYGNYQDTDRSSLMVNVSRLRKKLASINGLENTIETVWSKGYKFIAPY